jgi:hypothetical protein
MPAHDIAAMSGLLHPNDSISSGTDNQLDGLAPCPAVVVAGCFRADDSGRHMVQGRYLQATKAGRWEQNAIWWPKEWSQKLQTWGMVYSTSRRRSLQGTLVHGMHKKAKIAFTPMPAAEGAFIYYAEINNHSIFGEGSKAHI